LGVVRVTRPVQQALAFDEVQSGTITTYRLHFPYLPPSKNVFDGWPVQWKAGMKRKWIRAVADLCAEMNVPVGNPVVGLAAQLTFPTRQRRDVQNYAQCLWNWIPDGLVRCGVLTDDRTGSIQIGPNWGIVMALDTRKGVPAKRRQRTTVSLAIEGARWRGEAAG
jgi:hypothetical protein